MSGAAYSQRWKIGLGGALVAAVALVPWVRNHGFLRDFYDYGLFINVNARFNEGQRLFVDFSTPAQSATFALNHLAERMGGGTYLGMTWGAAALSAVMSGALLTMLSQRLPVALATLFATAVVACSASQHTIVFYNPIGVLAMALVVWSFAVAPLLRREQAGWHAVAALGLVVGGTNKINFHLLSCAMAVGWIVWGAIRQRASWRRVAATVGFVCVFGIILPLSLELAWTSASLRTWFHNVVELPLGARGGRVELLTDARVYFATLHDYYGQLRLPQSGLVVVLLPLLAVPAVWWCGKTTPFWLRGSFALLAGFCGAASGAALLLTNNEIVYLSVAASLVMLAGLWLGFDLPAGGRWPWLALGVPALLVGLCGWESAWLGQRSQFGHASEPREKYVDGASCGPQFAYLRGLAIPPSVADSLRELAAYRATLGEEADQVFYGPGTEWLEHIWPAPKVHGLPLVAAAFESERELAQLHREVIDDGVFRHVLVLEAWDSWAPSVKQEFRRRYSMDPVGRFFVYHRLRGDTLWARPLAFFDHIDGNIESTQLFTNLALQSLDDGRRFVGTMHGRGHLEVGARSYRISAAAVLRRVGNAPGARGPITFEAHAVSGAARYPRWSRELTLPADVNELIVPTEQLDASGLNMDFTVSVPPNAGVIAGWREPRLWNTFEGDSRPPRLQVGASPARTAEPALRQATLPQALADAPMFVRDAWARDGQCWLAPRGEVWIQLTGLVARIEITAQTSGVGPNNLPRLQVVYYKGGRLEVFNPSFDSATGAAQYTAWSSERGGWLGILADPHPSCPAFTIRFGAVERTP